jgi:hypothetical protein
MRRRLSSGGPPGGNGSRWKKIAWIAAIAIGFVGGGLYLYKEIGGNFKPGEGQLIVNVNSATQGELETIPGIGPALASLIIAGRPYARVEDLERVSGIGPISLNAIRPYVKVQGETEKH